MNYYVFLVFLYEVYVKILARKASDFVSCMTKMQFNSKMMLQLVMQTRMILTIALPLCNF